MAAKLCRAELVGIGETRKRLGRIEEKNKMDFVVKVIVTKVREGLLLVGKLLYNTNNNTIKQ